MVGVVTQPTRPPRPAAALHRGRRRLRGAALVLAAVGLVVGYARMSRTQPVNADGASNALQAWDMMHGNPLLHGWSVSDVSFYTTELIQYALVELLWGFGPQVIPVAAAITYTLLVLLVAALAKGGATGRLGWVRVAIALAIVLVPGPHTGYVILLGSPDHTGTAVPLLLAWLVLDRAGTRRWAPWAIAALLAWGQVGDPLVLFIGAAPLVAVGLLGSARARTWRGVDAGLAAAGLASVVLAQAFLFGVRLAGGFHAHRPILERSPLGEYGERAWIAVKALAVNFGVYFPDRHGPAAVAVGVLHLLGVLLAVTALGVSLARLLSRRRPAGGPASAGGPAGDRVVAVLAAGVLVNLAAFVVSALPADLMAARQLAVVLPYAAVLAARIWAARLASWRWLVGSRRRTVAAVGVLLVFPVAFVAQAAARPLPPQHGELVAWLEANGLRHGLGNYWTANNVSLAARGRITVAPVSVGDRIYGYRWESRADWYDPRHDARFLLVDLRDGPERTLGAAAGQFGQPVERRDFGAVAVLRYDHNLLVGLSAYCVPHVAPSMTQCG
jgi:hypothetical protein